MGNGRFQPETSIVINLKLTRHGSSNYMSEIFFSNQVPVGTWLPKYQNSNLQRDARGKCKLTL
jgi:hypothetical protein